MSNPNSLSLTSTTVAASHPTVCNMFIEELLQDHKSSDPCPGCKQLVCFHNRTPINSVSTSLKSTSSSSSSSTSSYINSKTVSYLPKWKTDFKQVKPFLQRFEQILIADNVHESNWPRLLLHSVENVSEANWIKTNIVDAFPVSLSSWTQVKEVFTKHFGLHSYQTKLISDYEKCSQFKGETVQKYADRFTQLCDELSYQDDDALVIQHYIVGLLYPIQADLKKHLHLAKLANSNAAVTLDSLKSVIELTLDLTLFDSSNQSNAGTSGTKDRNDNKDDNSGNKKKACKFHPDSTSHITAECRLNKNNNNNYYNTDKTQDSQPGTRAKTSTILKKNGKPVTCHACGGNHYANDPACPKHSDRTTRSHQSSNTNNNAVTLPSANSGTTPGGPSNISIQGRSVTVAEGISNSNNSQIMSPTSESSTLNFSAIARNLPESVIMPKSLPVMLLVNNQVFNTLVDTGADVSFIDEAITKELNLQIDTTNCNGALSMAHANMTTKRIGQVQLDFTVLFPHTDRKTMQLKHKYEVLPLFTPNKDYHFVIGRDLIPSIFPAGIPLAYLPESNSVNGQPSVRTVHINSTEVKSDSESTLVTDISMLTDVRPERLTVFTPAELDKEYSTKRSELLIELQDLLVENSKITGFCNLPESVVKLEINPEMKAKLYRRQYPIAQALSQPTTEVIQRWFDTGKICYAPPNCEFNNPLTVAPKKDADGKWTKIRVCLDVRALNKALINGDKFPIPYIRDALECFAGNSIFGEYDLAEAYLQFRLHPDSQPLTAFTWNRKQYMFVGCPYGVSPLTSRFQRGMSFIFHDMPFVIEYVDNIPFGSRDWRQHYVHNVMIVTRLNQVNLRLKPEYNIGHAQLKCLGHVLSINGVSPDPDKLQTIKDWPLPSTGTELGSFLGLCTFLRQHVRHYAEVTGPLDTFKLNKDLQWNDILIQHFEATKQALLKAPILTFPDFNKSFHIATDASGTGVGGVLFQPSNSDEHITANNIVAICSKKLLEHQRLRWPAYKKELFAVVYCLRKFHSYVWGRNDLVVHTDHKPLIHMFSSTQLSPALQQWLDVILDYNFDIRHRDGILNVIPDCLSRMFCSHYASSNTWGVSNKPFADASPIHINDVTLLNGENEANSSDTESKQLQSETIELLKRDKKCPATQAEKIELIQKAHLFGHFGREAVFKHLWNQGYWWLSIRRDVEIELQNCDACTRFVVVKQGFHPAQFITSNGPLEHIQIDTSTHLPTSPDGHTALLVCICIFTGFVILRPLKDTTAETVASTLWDIFCIIGFPKILQSDNGSEFVNDILRSLVKITGIEHRLITPYNPRADGKVERTIGSVMMVIKKLLNGTNNHWNLFVPFAQITFNNKVSSLTGSTPFSLMFGRSLNELKDYSSDPPTTLDLDDWKQHQDKIVSLIYPSISERIRSGKDKLVKQLNEKRRLLLPTALPAGSTVMIIDPVRKNKFEPKYVGPYIIIRRARNGAYVLKDIAGDLLDRHVTADQIKLISKSKRRIDAEKPTYEVKQIVDHKGKPGAYEYLVDWKGYSAAESTWEPETSFHDTSAIQDYWRKTKQ
jgi:hypothetical protein